MLYVRFIYLHWFARLVCRGDLHPHICSALVDNIDRLVRQIAVVNVLRGKMHRLANGFIGIADVMVFLVLRLQALQDLDGVFLGGLGHLYFLKPARQGTVFLEILAVLLVRGCPDTLKFAGCQRRLEHIGGVHGASRHRAGTYQRVNLINEQNGIVPLLQSLDDLLHPLFEVAAIPGPGDHSAHVEPIDVVVLQRRRNSLISNTLCKPLGNGGLADAGRAEVHRVVLHTTAQHLDRPLQNILSADKGLELAVPGGFREIGGELGEDVFLLATSLLLLLFFLRRLELGIAGRLFISGRSFARACFLAVIPGLETGNAVRNHFEQIYALDARISEKVRTE